MSFTLHLFYKYILIISYISYKGRDELIGTELFKLTDRKDKKLCLCPTHEEIVTSLVSKLSKAIPTNCLSSSNSLKLYQITRKYIYIYIHIQNSCVYTLILFLYII